MSRRGQPGDCGGRGLWPGAQPADDHAAPNAQSFRSFRRFCSTCQAVPRARNSWPGMRLSRVSTGAAISRTGTPALALAISCPSAVARATPRPRSEEHTSELQSPCNLVCRLLLEKKKKIMRDDNVDKIKTKVATMW